MQVIRVIRVIRIVRIIRTVRVIRGIRVISYNMSPPEQTRFVFLRILNGVL